MAPEVRVLSLRQPWASLVAMREKTIETRSWRTAWRGPLVIHASGTKPDAEAMRDPRILAALDRCGLSNLPLPHGVLLCATRVLTCFPICQGATFAGGAQLTPALIEDETGRRFEIAEREEALGLYQPGRWAWMLAPAQPFSPISASGMQGLWRPGPAAMGALMRAGLRWPDDARGEAWR